MEGDNQNSRSPGAGALILELLPPERLNTFIDAVYAIIMTLLVLDLKLPERLAPGEALQHLQSLEPKALAFAIGFCVAGSGWAYVHHVSALFTRSNLQHLSLNLVALLIASLIPFSASVMGAFPHTSYGPVAYSINVGVLTLIYALDLALCQHALIPPVVDRRLIWIVFGLATLAGVWCLFVGLVIAPWNADIALWGLGLHFLIHWTCLFLTERRVRKAAVSAERWHAEHEIRGVDLREPVAQARISRRSR
jgi:uncharacterized membrane protein